MFKMDNIPHQTTLCDWFAWFGLWNKLRERRKGVEWESRWLIPSIWYAVLCVMPNFMTFFMSDLYSHFRMHRKCFSVSINVNNVFMLTAPMHSPVCDMTVIIETTATIQSASTHGKGASYSIHHASPVSCIISIPCIGGRQFPSSYELWKLFIPSPGPAICSFYLYCYFSILRDQAKVHKLRPLVLHFSDNFRHCLVTGVALPSP